MHFNVLYCIALLYCIIKANGNIMNLNLNLLRSSVIFYYNFLFNEQNEPYGRTESFF